MPTRKRQAPVGQLRIRKLADRSAEGPPYPFAGLVIEAKPNRCHLPTEFVAGGIAEGWIETDGGTPVVRPAGLTQDDWNATSTGQPHMFIHYDSITFKTVDGDVRYRVTKQPDKYVDSSNPNQKVTPEIYAEGRTRVDHFYDCELA